MSALLYAVYSVPDYLMELFTGPYRYYAIGAALLYVVVLFFSGKVVAILRDIFVLAAVVLGVVCYFRRKYPLLWVCVFALLLLAIFRLFLYIIITVRNTRRANRIEKKALEKAEKRRGLWSEKRGYSGEKPADRTEPDDSAAHHGAGPADRGDYAGSPGEEGAGQYDAGIAQTPSMHGQGEPQGSPFTEGLPSPVPEEDEELPTFSREQAISAARKLRDLKDLGIMTDEEFELIKARLYARLD